MDGNGEAIRILRELREEQADLADLAGGIPDAMERRRVLRRRFDRVLPLYQLDVSSIGDTISVMVRPRYRGAERDDPILVNLVFVFSFPSTPTGQEATERLQRAFDYGEHVVLVPDYVNDLRVDTGGRRGRRPIIPISDAVDRSVTFGRRGNHRVGPCRAGLANGSLGR